MARTVEYWKNVLISAKDGSTELASLNSTSKVALWNFFIYCVAYCAWTLDVIFDLHKSDVDQKLLIQKNHRAAWYRQKALDFQYGYDLIPETDRYDNTGLTDDTISASKIIKNAAVTESDTESRLIIKIAGENSAGILKPISNPQKFSFEQYLRRIKDAGVFLTIINYLPDKLFLNLRIYFDPLILDANGVNIVDGGKPVEEALKQFLRELPFNGELILAKLVDKLQAVPGVVIPQLDDASTSFIKPELSGYGPPVSIDVRKQPASGYFEIVDFDDVVYLPYV